MKKLLFALLIVMLVIILGGCGSSSRPSTYNVRYSIEGTDSIDLTYKDKDEKSIEITVTLPWSYEFTGTKGNLVMISYSRNSNNDVIVSKIFINGSVKSENIHIDNTDDYSLIEGVFDTL